MSKYDVVIGLEIHVQLNTASKIFCSCSNRYGDDPNINVCPFCLGHPGSLPRLNEKAIEKAVLAGLALNCEINNHSYFDRKLYFYPDLGSNFQRTQFSKPIAHNGFCEIEIGTLKKKIRIKEMHLEEDAGKLIHPDDDLTISLVDMNRAGCPLIEIVTEPDISSAEEAYAFASKLRMILKFIDVTDGNMEEGSLRFDVNLSLKEKGNQQFGIRTETKNLNSFSALKDLVELEIQRQEDLLMKGEQIKQETRLYNHETKVSRMMRQKGDAADYRYIWDPDIPAISISSSILDDLKQRIKILPDDYVQQFIQLGVKKEDAIFFASDRFLAEYLTSFAAILPQHAQNAANFFLSNILRLMNDQKLEYHQNPITIQQLVEIFEMIDENKISMKIAKDLLMDMFKTGQSIKDLVNQKGLLQIVDEDQIVQFVKEVLRDNVANVELYHQGKKQLLGFFVGKVLQKSGGKANPKMVNEILIRELDS